MRSFCAKPQRAEVKRYLRERPKDLESCFFFAFRKLCLNQNFIVASRRKQKMLNFCEWIKVANMKIPKICFQIFQIKIYPFRIFHMIFPEIYFSSDLMLSHAYQKCNTYFFLLSPLNLCAWANVFTQAENFSGLKLLILFRVNFFEEIFNKLTSFPIFQVYSVWKYLLENLSALELVD